MQTDVHREKPAGSSIVLTAMLSFDDPIAASGRVRSSTQLLSAPQDLEVVARCLADLEVSALQQEAEEARRLTPKIEFSGFVRASAVPATN